MPMICSSLNPDIFIVYLFSWETDQLPIREVSWEHVTWAAGRLVQIFEKKRQLSICGLAYHCIIHKVGD